jgi:pyruvate dehydrogenase E1 component alpha subunit
MLGDGASNQGQYYEAANMAGLWKLPVIYTIENNFFGMGTSVDRSCHYKPLMGKFRGFPGIRLDGSNVFAVREGTRFCKEWVLENGPIILELVTYRYQGHSVSDPGISYRTKEEVTDYRGKHDCIGYVKNLLLTNKFMTEDELKKIDRDIKERIQDEIEKIKNDPYPDSEEMYNDIYVHEKPNFIRNADYQSSVFNNSKY